MIVSKKKEPIMKWWFAWYPVYLIDTQETVWLERVWKEKIPLVYYSGYKSAEYYLKER
jgi:hypothetical protein